MYPTLDLSHARAGARDVVSELQDAGYTVEEIVPILIQGVVDVAHDDESILDDAANLLADGGVDE